MDTISYKLHMPLWSRLKHLFGVPIFVSVKANNISNVTVVMDGEVGKPVVSVSFNKENETYLI